MTFGEFMKKRAFGCVSFLLNLLAALWWTAERVNYAGISKALGADTNRSFWVMNLPIAICILLWVLAALSLLGLLVYEKSRALSVITVVTAIVFTGVIAAVIYLGSYEYLPFITYHFLISLFYTGLILFAAIILLFPLFGGKKGAWQKTLILALCIALAVLIGYELRPNRISCDAVVYAVEDEYQIVFSTTDNSVAWVEIGGTCYYDLYAGSMRSKDLVHKITVPQSVLDEAKAYTVCAQQMIYRGPFGGIKGEIITRQHTFRPVDTTDGIFFYTLSDIHENFKGAIAAAQTEAYALETLDFLIIAGDTVSMVEREKDAQGTNYVASAVTGGEIPVVYARGNHEIKGEMAEELYKYVGSKDQKFYYTFRLSGIRGIVLDLGEDHDDDWWEYYETAQFDAYRAEQTKMLEKLREEDYFADSTFNIVVCHIPVSFVNYRRNHQTVKNAWTRTLNSMNVDIAVYGHQHDLTVFEPGSDAVEPFKTLTYNPNFSGVEGKTYSGYLAETNFYGFMGGRAALDQLSEPKLFTTKEFTGLSVIVRPMDGGMTRGFFVNVQWINSLHEAVPVCNMFGTDFFRNEIIYQKKR